jgi:D-alanyl-D-alanine dipeptidase
MRYLRWMSDPCGSPYRRSMTILMSDARVTRIPLREVDEPTVDLLDLAPAATGLSRFVRRGVLDRLRAADRALPAGIRLRVVEGCRSTHDQAAIIAAYGEQVRAARPRATDQEVHDLTSRYVAPLAMAPHVAGAAVDLTLVDADGQELWMGSALDATPEESEGRCFTDAEGLDEIAIRHRTMLVAALAPTGLVNYPTEWWHWSFGDRYWAYVTGSSHALYGPLPMADAA